jgi:isoleucyl-tRNA synthetase
MKAVSSALTGLDQHEIAELEKNRQILLQIDEETVPITIDEVEITAEDIPGWSVASKGALTVALDVTLTDELRKEGEAREFVNRVQNLRKDTGLELTDRILLKVLQNGALESSINEFKNYICAEILAENIEFVSEISDGTSIEVNDITLTVSITKKG